MNCESMLCFVIVHFCLRTTLFYGASSLQDCVCEAGFIEKDGVCVECGIGLACPRGSTLKLLSGELHVTREIPVLWRCLTTRGERGEILNLKCFYDSIWFWHSWRVTKMKKCCRKFMFTHRSIAYIKVITQNVMFEPTSGNSLSNIS